MEEWRNIKDYENYEVSNLGRVRNKNGKILKQQLRHGYYDVGLYNKYHQNQPKLLKVHRLVAQAFIPNLNNYPCINHKDENKLNNNIDNLEWCTYSYNCNYGHRNDTRKRQVLKLDSNYNIIKKYYNISEAAKDCNTHISCIIRSCKTHYKAAGFFWKYF